MDPGRRIPRYTDAIEPRFSQAEGPANNVAALTLPASIGKGTRLSFLHAGRPPPGPLWWVWQTVEKMVLMTESGTGRVTAAEGRERKA